MTNTFHSTDSSTSLWKQTTVLRNAQGQEEAISVGPDGNVWSFIANCSDNGFEASGPRLENLGMHADFITVGNNDAGALIVIAAKGLNLQYRTETPLAAPGMAGKRSHRWTPAKPIPLPTIAGAVGIRRLYTQNDFSGMRIALIVDTKTAEHGSSYVMACCRWTENGPGPFILLPPLGAPKAAPARVASARMFHTAQAA